jgi:methionyl-tRNA formyltransferase
MIVSRKKVVLFGMDSRFSRVVLERLLDRNPAKPCALVLPASQPRGFPLLRVQGRNSIAANAASAGIPVWVPHDDEEMVARLDDIGAEFLLVACFPCLLSPYVTAAASRSCLNLHPSLLPRYRGPDPLFWQLRDAAGETGVTLHHVEPRLDAGAIVDARRVSLSGGATRVEIETALAEAGAELFVSAVSQARDQVRVPQDETRASFHPPPLPSDYHMPAYWPVTRAYNFLRGAAPVGQVFEISEGRRSVRVRDAQNAWAERRAEFIVENDQWVEVRFSDGVIRASRA